MPNEIAVTVAGAIRAVPQGLTRSAPATVPPTIPVEANAAPPKGQNGYATAGMVTDVCGELMRWQRERVFAITMQGSIDRRAEAYICRHLGYSPAMDEAAGKKLWATARAVRTQIEDGKPTAVAEACAHTVIRCKESREIWDEYRNEAESRMRELSRALPVWTFVKGVRGVSDLGLAVIVGEAGDLGGYPDDADGTKPHRLLRPSHYGPGCLSTRLGMAVVDGRRQGDPGAKATSEDWIEHGYSKKRRGQVWAMLDDVMLRGQWRGDKDEDGADPKKTGKPVAAPAHAIGPYGEHYGRKKAEYISLNEQRAYAPLADEILYRQKNLDKKTRAIFESGRITPKHIDNRARRYMAKMFLKDLWTEWYKIQHAA